MTHGTAKVEREGQIRKSREYYGFHSKFYDLTRWSFLFGRKGLLKSLPFSLEDPFSLLEVGCGTGQNLLAIGKLYPRGKLLGLDVSPGMLGKARKKLGPYSTFVELKELPYSLDGDPKIGAPFDAILFSYCLSVVNPNWKDLILQAHRDLRPGGVVAVVDFHDSPFLFFQRHMKRNHVEMNSHLLPFLRSNFEECEEKVKQAYLGLWSYFTFIGQRKRESKNLNS